MRPFMAVKRVKGNHFNEDTNFGKMKRIPYRPLQEFLKQAGCQFAPKGIYPTSWSMSEKDVQLALARDVAGKNPGDGGGEVNI